MITPACPPASALTSSMVKCAGPCTGQAARGCNVVQTVFMETDAAATDFAKVGALRVGWAGLGVKGWLC